MIDLIGKLDHLEDDPGTLDAFWRFARGDTSAADFEAWLYAGGDVETALGQNAYLDAISVDFRDAKQIAEFRGRLHERLPSPNACDCHTIADFGGHIDYVIGGSIVDEVFDRTRTDHFDWLYRLTCITCSTRWIAAHDEDLTIVMVRNPAADTRTTPSHYIVVRLAIETDRSLPPSLLRPAIEELARETPGISLTDLQRHLPTDQEVLRQQALEVVARTGLSIDFSADSEVR